MQQYLLDSMICMIVSVNKKLLCNQVVPMVGHSSCVLHAGFHMGHHMIYKAYCVSLQLEEE